MPIIDGFKYWKKEDFNEESPEDDSGDSKDRDNIMSRNYRLKASSSAKRMNVIVSSPLKEGKLSSSRSDSKLLSFGIAKRNQKRQ